MDLFEVVKLDEPRLVTIGVRPKGENEEGLMKATDGRVVDLHIPVAEGSPHALEVPPVQSVPPSGQRNPVVPPSPPPQNFIPVYKLDDSEDSEEESPLQKRGREDDGAGSSKRARTEVGSTSARYVFVIQLIFVINVLSDFVKSFLCAARLNRSLRRSLLRSLPTMWPVLGMAKRRL